MADVQVLEFFKLTLAIFVGRLERIATRTITAKVAWLGALPSETGFSPFPLLSLPLCINRLISYAAHLNFNKFDLICEARTFDLVVTLNHRVYTYYMVFFLTGQCHPIILESMRLISTEFTLKSVQFLILEQILLISRRFVDCLSTLF